VVQPEPIPGSSQEISQPKQRGSPARNLTSEFRAVALKGGLAMLGTVHTCTGGGLCSAASTISALVVAGFIILAVGGVIAAGVQKLRSPAPPPQSQRGAQHSQSATGFDKPSQQFAGQARTAVAQAPDTNTCIDCAEPIGSARYCQFCGAEQPAAEGARS
jgi:predicted phage tail protein